MTDLPKKFQESLDRAMAAPKYLGNIANRPDLKPYCNFYNECVFDIPLFAEALKIAMEALKVYAKGPDLRMGDDDHHIVSHENGMAGMLRFTIMMKDSDVAKDALDAIEKLGDGE